MQTTRFLTAMACASALFVAGATAHANDKADKNIVQIASQAGQFNTLVAAVKAAGLADTLQGEGPFTVFAPTDEAFAKLPAGTIDELLKPANRSKLAAILTYHVVPGSVKSSAVKTAKAKTVNGKTVQLKVSDQGVHIDNAKVVKSDIMASNGVIHVIDHVILPQ